MEVNSCIPWMFSDQSGEVARINADGSWSVDWDRAQGWADRAIDQADLSQAGMIAMARLLISARGTYPEVGLETADAIARSAAAT